MQCDMCGNKVETLSKGLVEGVTMSVCSNCMKYAKPIPKSEKPQNHKVPDKIYGKKYFVKELESTEYIVDDFSEIIKSARQKLQIPQKALAVKLAEKESVIHSLETGKHEPSISLAKKIEKLLNVKLVAEDVKSDNDLLNKLTSSKNSSKSENMTLGDAIVIRKRK